MCSVSQKRSEAVQRSTAVLQYTAVQLSFGMPQSDRLAVQKGRLCYIAYDGPQERQLQ